MPKLKKINDNTKSLIEEQKQSGLSVDKEKDNILKEIEDNKEIDYESNDSDYSNSKSLSSNEGYEVPIKDIHI